MTYNLLNLLFPYIDLVTPITDLGGENQHGSWHINCDTHNETFKRLHGRRHLNNLSIRSRFMTSVCIRAMYGIPISASNHANNTLGVYEPAWASWLPADLNTPFGRFRPELVGRRPPIVPLNRGLCQDQIQGLPSNAEANLDLQATMSLVAPGHVVNFQVRDMYHAGTYTSLLAAFDGSYCSFLNSTINREYPNI